MSHVRMELICNVSETGFASIIRVDVNSNAGEDFIAFMDGA
jgi:hypothetical protein